MRTTPKTHLVPAGPRRTLACALAALTALTTVACGSDSPTPGSDAGLDGGPMPMDASTDLGFDAGVDGGPQPDMGPQLANGANCLDNDACASTQCLTIPFLGGQCGECDDDEDCLSGGCTVHSPYAATGSTCNDGSAGDGCESDDACSGDLHCGVVLDILGLIELGTCGQCATDADCTDGAAAFCTPIVDTEEFSGQRFCLAANSLSLDDYCDLDGGGETQCASNFCSPVDANGLAEVGACGECQVGSDMGCQVGETCTAGTYDLNGTGALTGSRCTTL